MTKVDSSAITNSKEADNNGSSALEVYDDDDMYVLPVENYSKMDIQQYADLMLSRENLSGHEINTATTIARLGCQVYFVDECTSILYHVV